MKKILFAIGLLSIFWGNAQEDSMTDAIDKNELKLNTTNLIIFSFLDGSYEYLINEESSFGIGVLANLGGNRELDTEEYRTFSVTPYYRQFFSKKYAKGFFVEGFGMFNTREADFFQYDSNLDIVSSEERTSTNFALGVSIGGKFVTKKGFVAEIYTGLGRNLFNDDDYFDTLVGRGGISLGYRF